MGKKKPVDEQDDMAYADTDSDVDMGEGNADTQPSFPLPKLFRLSSRVASLKRRGKFQLPQLESEEFDFYAEDYLTVRAPDQDFYLCRVLEDVSTKTNQMNVAWYDRVGKNRFKVSYDDFIFKASVLSHVQLREVPGKAGEYFIPKKFIKETQELLKESLEKEGVKYVPNSSDEEAKESDGEDDDEPVVKKRRASKGSSQKTTKGKQSPKKSSSKKAGSKRAKDSTPQKPKRRKGLIPNPDIQLLSEDPTFCKASKVPLLLTKQAIRAVLNDDPEQLKDLISDVENIYSVLWPRSIDVNLTPLSYALLKGDQQAIEMLLNALEERDVKAKKPISNVNHRGTGRYNFYTFNHPVRDITVSRGNKEGDNAFNYDEYTFPSKIQYFTYAVKKNVPFEIMEKFFITDRYESQIFELFTQAVRNGYLQLAGEIAERAEKNGGHGFNVLHKEVLCNNAEPLTPFKAISVTKKSNYVTDQIAPLHSVCINPNVKYCEEVFQSNPAYNFPDKWGNVPIHYAAACTSNGPLKFLLQRSVDANAINKRKDTPLIFAAKSNRPHNIDTLMECTIDNEDEYGNLVKLVNINAKNTKGKAAIHYAAKKGHLEAVKSLVENGAKIDLTTTADKENMTALGYAAALGHYEIVKYLVDKGANPEFRMRRRKTPLIYAAMNGQSQVIAYLLHIGVDPDAPDSSDNTPIHYAAAYGWYHTVRLLLESGANANVSNNWKTTPLAIALLKQHLEVSDLLLSCDLDVNFPDDNGRTILMKNLNVDFEEKQLELLTHLVKRHKADVKIRDVTGWTAFHYLASTTVVIEESRQGNSYWNRTIFKSFKRELSDICLKIARLLLKAGADLNAENNDGETPLMIAVKQHNYPLIGFLIENGASVTSGYSKQDKSNAFHIIVKHSVSTQWDYTNLSEMYPDEILTQEPPESAADRSEILEKVDEERINMDKRAKIELLTSVLKQPCDVNVISEIGETGLMIAASSGNVDVCKMLLKENADPNLGVRENGENLFHILAKTHNFEILKEVAEKPLLSEVVNRKAKDGFTPLLAAGLSYHSLSQYYPEYQERVRQFFDFFISKCGADPKICVGKKEDHGVEQVDDHVGSENDEEEENNLLDSNSTTLGLFDDSDNGGNESDNGGNESGNGGNESDNESDLENNKIDGNFGCDDGTDSDVEEEKPKKKKEKIGQYEGDSILFFLKPKEEKSWSKENSVIDVVVRHLGDNKELFNKFNAEGFALLHSVMLQREKSADFLKYLIEQGCDPNLVSKDDSFQCTPLLLAPYCSTEVILLFISISEDVNFVNKSKYDMGHIICYGKESHEDNVRELTADEKIRIFNALMQKGYTHNKQDSAGHTPLHHAILAVDGDYEELTEFEEFLVKKGASLTVASSRGETPLHAAFTKLKKDVPTSVCDPMSIINVLCDVKNMDEKSVQNLVNMQDEKLRTALHYGCYRGANISCSKLLKHSADVSIEDVDGNTPLSMALKNLHRGCVMTMLQQGASPLCKVVDAVTKKQLKKYKKKKREMRWIWKFRSVQPKQMVTSPFRVAVQQDWKDVAYTMLEVSELPIFNALKAAIIEGKWNLVLTLLSKQKYMSGLLGKDETKKTLLHFLAEHTRSYDYISNCGNDFATYYDSENDKLMQPFVFDKRSADSIELAKRFLNAGVKLTDIDEEGVTALHLCIKENPVLAQFFIKLSPKLLHVKDSLGKTPLVYVIDQLKRGADKNIDISTHILKECLDNGAEIDVCYHNDKEASTSTTVLNTAVLMREVTFKKGFEGKEMILLQMLLNEKRANVNFASREGMTPLIVAIRHNYEDMFDLVLSKKPNLDVQDSRGNSYVHACVKSCDFGSYENVKMLRKLLKAGAPTELKNSANETPLDLARKQHSGVMEKILMKESTQTPMEVDSKKSNLFTFKRASPSIKTFDFLLDAEKEIKLHISDVVKDLDNEVRVDAALNMENAGEVYYNPAENKPYDVTLTRVDTKWGEYGLNLFYKLQIIRHKGRNLWILFNRWGRIGDNQGQHQQTPFVNAEEAVTEFEKVFRSKTGNLWCNVDSFEQKPNKYAVLRNENNPERMKKYQQKVLRSFQDVDTSLVESTLPKPLKRFMKSITNVKDAITNSFPVDTMRMPLGLITMENINKAKSLLEKIEATLNKADTHENKTNTIDEFEEIAKLSNQYYMLLPPEDFAFESIRPINTKHQLMDYKRKISLVTELSTPYRILLGAQYRLKEISPYDYCFSVLNVRMEAMDPATAESKLISRMIYRENSSTDNPVFWHKENHENSSRFKVKNVFKVEQKNQAGYRDDLENKKLLFHGTSIAHMIGILKEGLRIAPTNATRHGSSFGDGIYFSWDFETALGFSSTYSRGSSDSFVLLCEVAVGKMEHFYKRKEISTPPKKADSIWCETDKIPNPQKFVTTPYGATAMVGEKIANDRKKIPKGCYFYGRPEAIVYDEKQVKIRYIVQV